MNLTHSAFKVLSCLRDVSDASQREISSKTGLSLGSVNSAVKELNESGLLFEGKITDAGYEALHPYKVDNAIILAAGLSSRFAPISYEKPKGLLRVRGEVLIERQIEQLQDAGIKDITIVVGYRKEYFFYLEASMASQLWSTTNTPPRTITRRCIAFATALPIRTSAPRMTTLPTILLNPMSGMRVMPRSGRRGLLKNGA